MKACRKFLEQDLGLPEKSLADRKELIRLYVDKASSVLQQVVWLFELKVKRAK